ncbi:hypothetical protein BCR34DRAFT_592803 [Clohesyomyces aquaticus]|uniref:Uncharacterized protein n=1 Tax=Clohesyomyces aquaticus TaxID=1231657 RepID=A0A1Y1YPY6_9PLEO|nr:hypothetical protein BCR34DRAFT_592803 [Clohesyomyces aquaticus]
MSRQTARPDVVGGSCLARSGQLSEARWTSTFTCDTFGQRTEAGEGQLGRGLSSARNGSGEGIAVQAVSGTLDPAAACCTYSPWRSCSASIATASGCDRSRITRPPAHRANDDAARVAIWRLFRYRRPLCNCKDALTGMRRRRELATTQRASRLTPANHGDDRSIAAVLGLRGAMWNHEVVASAAVRLPPFSHGSAVTRLDGQTSLASLASKQQHSEPWPRRWGEAVRRDQAPSSSEAVVDNSVRALRAGHGTGGRRCSDAAVQCRELPDRVGEWDWRVSPFLQRTTLGMPPSVAKRAHNSQPNSPRPD